MKFRSLSLLTAGLAVTACVGRNTHAATLHWDGSVAASPGLPWADAANWSAVPGAAAPDPAAPPGSGDDVVFNIAGATARTLIHLGADQAVRSFTFNSPGGADIFNNASGVSPQRLLTIGKGGITLNSGGGQVVFGAEAATLGTLTAQINDSQTWTNRATAPLAIYGSNATAVAIVSGKQLTFAGPGPIQIGQNTGSLANVTGAGGIVMSGTGVLTLSGDNSHGGGTILNSGTIALGHAGALGTGASLTVNGGTLRSDSISARNLTGKLAGLTLNADVVMGSVSHSGVLLFDGLVSLGGSTRTLTLNSSVVINSSAAGKITGAAGAGLVKSGPGTLMLGGTVGHAFTGGVTVNGGSLSLRLAEMTTPANILAAANTLTLANGSTVALTGKASTGSSQTFGSLTAGPGLNQLSASAGTGAALGLTFSNAWTRTAFGGLNITTGGGTGVTVTSSPSLTNGIIGPWVTMLSGSNPASYATVKAGAVEPLTSGPNHVSVAQSSGLTGTAGDLNYELTAAGTAPNDTVPGGFAGNTVRYTAATAGTTRLGGSFSVNGLMNAVGLANAPWTIDSGTLTIGASRELVITTSARSGPNGNGILINAVIADNAAGASGLTHMGLSSYAAAHPAPLTLGTGNTYTGKTVINGSYGTADGLRTILISALRDAGVPSEFGAGSEVVLNSAIIQTGTTGSSNRSISLAGTGGFYVKGDFTQTITGSISGSGNLSTDGDTAGPATAGGTGNLVLAGDNSFTGSMLFQNDSRVTLGHVNALKNATLVMSGQRILADLATHNLACNIGGLEGGVSIDLGSGSAAGGSGFITIGSNNQSNSYAGALSGSAGLVKTGTGIQTLSASNTYSGNTVVQAGRLRLVTTSTTTMTGSGAVNATTITSLRDTSLLAVGQPVSGPGVAAGAMIASIDTPTQVTVSTPHASAFFGTLTFGGQTTTLVSPVIEVQSGAVLDVADAGGFSITTGQTLAGDGAVEGKIAIAGTLNPGTSGGGTATLTTGDVVFSATGEYACHLAGNACDRLAAGALTVDPAAKITFTGFSAAASLLIATYSGAEPVHFLTDASLPPGCSLDYSTPGQIRLLNASPGSPYQNWANTKGLSGAEAAPDADPDRDRLANAVEFVIGGEPNPASPSADSSGLAPTVAATATDLVFTFRRTDLALTQPGIAVAVRFGSNLNTWTEAAIPATTPGAPVNGAAITITQDGFGAGVDKVEVRIPRSLAVGARLFAVLEVTIPAP
ncbi:MAG: autotransporter-associated beta strand repeat-containing protein [Verrucomicrobiales bacterium]|nr:autotransporter-associated beta strand repeat-containing protein [Verrucomicrobiales bacterium]